MTAAEVKSVITSGTKIDKNVFNFFFAKYKKYEPLLVKKKGPLTMAGNDLIDRDTLIEYIEDPKKPEYKEPLLRIYDDIKFRMTWYDVIAIYSTTAQCYNCERYDLSNVEAISENVYAIKDRDTGEIVFPAADQVASIHRYSYDQELNVMNYETGEIETIKCNQGFDDKFIEKHRAETPYVG